MNELPQNVRVGMDVYDSEENHIGTVEELRFGDESAASGANAAGMRDESLVEQFLEALWPDDMPEEERKILLAEGYLVLDAKGILQRDRFIRPGQIESVSEDRVVLNVRKGDLVKT